MMLLEIKNLVAGYLPDVNVLQGINICVEAGELVCMIGPNGAGKSTVLRTISGLLKPSSGKHHLRRKRDRGAAAGPGAARRALSTFRRGTVPSRK